MTISHGYVWGSSEWRTHMRRKLAQRKRNGENIKDIEGLIDYIEQQGPAESNSRTKTVPKSKSAKKKTTTFSRKRRQITTITQGKAAVGEKPRVIGINGQFASPTILRIR